MGPQLRWGLIRKVYAVVAMQSLFLFAVVGYVVDSDQSIRHFFAKTTLDLLVWSMILEAAIFISTIVVGQNFYPFWAVKIGKSSSYLVPIVFAYLLMFIVFHIILFFGNLIIQIFFPLGHPAETILACLTPIIFCGCIAFDTHSLIKYYTCDKNIQPICYGCCPFISRGEQRLPFLYKLKLHECIARMASVVSSLHLGIIDLLVALL